MHRSKSNRSYFLRFLYSYLLILLVPFLTIFVTYFSADYTVRNEILLSSENSLHQFFGNVDTRLSEMMSTCFKAMQDSSVKRRCYSLRMGAPENGYETYEIKQYLNGLPQDTFSDVFVYYYLSDQVISANYSALAGEYYSTTYYSALGDSTVEDFRRLLTVERGNTPRLISLGGPITRPNLAVVMGQNTGYALASPEMSVCAVLQPALLEQMLKSANFHRDGIILIFDEEGTPLAASAEFSGELDLSRYENDILKEDTIGGERYVVQVHASEVLSCTYVSLTPVSAFWERLNMLRIIALVSMLLCMGVSAFVTIYLTRRNYSPITSLLSTIRTKTNRSYDRREQNELEFVRTVLQQSLEENDLLSSRIENESHALQEDFLLRALQGSYNQDCDDEDAFSAYQIRLLSDKFGVILLQVEEYDKDAVGGRDPAESQRILSFILANVFPELSAAVHQGFLLELGSMRYVGVLNFRSGRDEELLEDARALCGRFGAFLSEHFGILCTFAMSDVQSGLSGLHLAYSQALQAMSYRFVYGRGRRILYRDIRGRLFCYNSAADSKAAQILLHYVQLDSPGDPQRTAAEVAGAFSLSQESAFETFQCYRYEIANTLNKIARQIGSVPPDEEADLLRGLLEAETLADYQRSLAEAVEKLRLHRAASRETHTICDRAAAYIRGHYADPDLNNNALGNILGISPSYLSKLFKLQFGVAPLDYLAQLRIGEAKNLLQQTAFTMDEIAAKTGFLTGPALIKAFRRLEGITPGAYRKLMQEAETLERSR